MDFREFEDMTKLTLALMRDTDISEPVHIDAVAVEAAQVEELATRGTWFNFGILDRFLSERQRCGYSDLLMRGFLADYALYEEAYRFHFATPPFSGVRPPHDKEIMWFSQQDTKRLSLWMGSLAIFDDKGRKGERLFRLGIQTNKVYISATETFVEVYCPVVVCSEYVILYSPSRTIYGLVTELAYTVCQRTFPDIAEQEAAFDSAHRLDGASVSGNGECVESGKMESGDGSDQEQTGEDEQH